VALFILSLFILRRLVEDYKTGDPLAYCQLSIRSV